MKNVPVMKNQMQVECTFIGIVFIGLFSIASGLNGLVYIGITGGHGMVMNWNVMDYAHGGLLGKCILVDEIKLYGETENDKALDESLCQDSFSEMKL